MAQSEYMISTVDNPFDPYTQFNDWYAYDERMGYHTCSMLDRVMRTSFELSEADQVKAYQDAVDEMIQENVLGLYKKVYRQ